ncbi:Holliday junction branch migration protein RuvA [Endozoicomonas sp. SM1973]|uniref:Holliday junction branch migration complex subunit RuvA n=1 Tax=Spartinivicinus marinus TaxID=2994442 RepID=A0A853IBP8_9GAMM|nr:Holliday junction branch migration protein RuvA [Spartinivicinus marinus]MCX4028730.1 Holliday junction branch migration protein RuvA [Spartinivicinus marinus]NYZ68008.1 Holliday junction branch migration protein RuvA [Spartinivicinus marinus]
MIGRIKGVLLEKQPPHLLIDVQGVAYEVDAPMTTFYQLPETGQTVVLYTHFVVREDAQQLYGFAAKQERELFRVLIKVNGVGPKLALTILSGMSSDSFVRTVQDNDVASLVKLPGVGKKTAERLLVEMRDKLTSWLPIDADLTVNITQQITSPESHLDDAISALVALGYKPQQATKAIKALPDQQLPSEELIRQALKAMV